MRPPESRRVFAISTSILLAIGVLGCGGPGGEPLVVATDWAEADCLRIEDQFRLWSARPGASTDRPTRLDWVRLAPGDAAPRRAGRLRGVDVVLGGPIASYRRLADSGGLLPIDDTPAWRVVRSTPLGVILDPEFLKRSGLSEPRDWADLGRPALSGRLAIGDPRRDPVTLGVARSLVRGRWPEGYAEVVRMLANAARIEPGGSLPRIEVDRGAADAAIAPVEFHKAGFTALRPPISSIEGAGVLREARDPDRALAFLRFLSEGVAQAVDEPAPKGGDLLADLIGSTLVDAHEELRDAWSARNRDGGSGLAAIVEAPPWPPAIVDRLRSSANSAGLVETLAEQIAPNPVDRSWLLESWDRARRPIDGGFLDEIASVGGGRLVRSPGFRAWLRSEWTAWARRQYGDLARSPGVRPA